MRFCKALIPLLVLTGISLSSYAAYEALKKCHIDHEAQSEIDQCITDNLKPVNMSQYAKMSSADQGGVIAETIAALNWKYYKHERAKADCVVAIFEDDKRKEDRLGLMYWGLEKAVKDGVEAKAQYVVAHYIGEYMCPNMSKVLEEEKTKVNKAHKMVLDVARTNSPGSNRGLTKEFIEEVMGLLKSSSARLGDMAKFTSPKAMTRSERDQIIAIYDAHDVVRKNLEALIKGEIQHIEETTEVLRLP